MTGIILLLGVIILVAGRAEERQFLDLLYGASPLWILAGAALQLLTYFCAAKGWRLILARLGYALPLGSMILLAVAKLFTDQAVPSGGLSGNVLLARALHRRLVPREAAMTTILLTFVAYYWAYAIGVAGAMLVIWLQGKLDKLLLTMTAGFGLVALAIPLAIFWFRRHPRLLPAEWLRKFPLTHDFEAALERMPRTPGGPALIAQMIGWQELVFLIHAATLFMMLRAVGHPLGFAPALASYMIASVTRTMLVVPGGLGTFEGASIAMLHLFEVPFAPALAATLLLRGFTFWLPMLPGMWLARREMAKGG
ncbi:MAG: lysylphosphatidylglycerol synthase transmembrane domain-containing protein [Desulfobacteraceae bacterium]|nr:lysylphosphatidylglycerol synthase transmembrane domain-containing protein [Desulfobacteraceae bacterium]